MDEHIDSQLSREIQQTWNTLDELHAVALKKGCTPAQFANAVETVGTNPRHVAAYLQRLAFMSDASGATKSQNAA